ncbi:MAG: PD40 domain-containing protein [Deltaproteobacteria bacterium]|nr:PD40 domain-containing protein [Deltaproteobacteria bacterium]
MGPVYRRARAGASVNRGAGFVTAGCALLLLAAGCHRIARYAPAGAGAGDAGRGGDGPVSDATPVADGGVAGERGRLGDGRPDAPRDAAGPDWGAAQLPLAFASAQPIPGVNVAVGDYDPHLSSDGLRLYFASYRPTGTAELNLWVASRASATATVWQVEALKELNTDEADAAPTLTEDELTIVFDRPDARGDRRLYLANRSQRGLPFGAPRPVGELTVKDDGFEPGISGDGLTLVFATRRAWAGGGGMDLWTSRRVNRTSPFDAPAPLEGVNTAADERNPALFGADGLVFSSNRAGGAGGLDLYVSYRVPNSPALGAPVRLAALATASDDQDPMVCAPQRLLLFSRASSAGSDLFWARY